MATAVDPNRPKFRHDQLVAEAIEDHGTRFVDVMDPDSGNAFRFYEVEFSLACAMDGQRDVAGIAQWAKDELGLAPSQSEIRTVISTLGDLGYLDAAAAAKAASTTPAISHAPAPVDGLAPGIVVPTQPRQPGAVEMELGDAGVTARTPAPDMPRAPDLALGASGPSHSKSTRPLVEDVTLGAPGRLDPVAPLRAPVSDVSIDLAEQMTIKPDDVKEAVRASKVMQAVDIPPELAAALEEPPPSRPEPVVAKPAPLPVEKPVARPPVAEKPAIVAKPVDKPVQPKPHPIEEKRPVAPETGKHISPVLIVVLILVIGAAAAYFIWKYVIASSNETTETSMVKEPVKPPPPKEPPKPPPPPPIHITMDTPPAQDVKATAAGTVETIEPATVVKRDAIVVRMLGSKPIAAEIKNLSTQLDRVRGELLKAEADVKAAEEANNAAKAKDLARTVDDRKKSMTAKEEALAKKQLELDKLVIRAPVDGEVKVSLKPGAKLAEGDTAFALAPSPVLRATFKVDAPPKLDSNVYVLVKGTDNKLTCRVANVNSDGVGVVCPPDTSIDTKEVTYGGAAPETPATPEIDMGTPPPPTPTPTPTPKQPPVQPPVQPKPADKPADKPAETKPAEGTGSG